MSMRCVSVCTRAKRVLCTLWRYLYVHMYAPKLQNEHPHTHTHTCRGHSAGQCMRSCTEPRVCSRLLVPRSVRAWLPSLCMLLRAFNANDWVYMVCNTVSPILGVLSRWLCLMSAAHVSGCFNNACLADLSAAQCLSGCCVLRVWLFYQYVWLLYQCVKS